jgi:peptidoglycan/xylan/chitin deacetylase (PgdA/CDA1 family)
MRIAVIHAGGVLYLAGSPDATERGFPEAHQLRFEGAVEVQSVAAVRAPAIRHIDRGNLSTTVRFATTRIFATPAAAEEFATAYDAPPPPSPGLLVFQTTGPAESEAYLYLPRAVIQPPQRQVSGRAVTLSYSATGGTMRQWIEGALPTPPPLTARMTDDADGSWLEVGFQTTAVLTGDALNGWTDSAGNAWKLQETTDLSTWHDFQFSDCAGSPADLGGGIWEYWSRCAVPRVWFSVLTDLTATSDRYGKSITGITAQGSAVSLSYPYAMPADAATLQADLRTAGFTGALVSATTGSLVARAIAHAATGDRRIVITMSGASVTGASVGGSSISLSYPYAMPGDAATLQTDLRSAGYPGAVVTLHADTWSILLPDRTAGGYDRDFTLEIDPGDPFPYWDNFGTYLGEDPDTLVRGTAGNVRSPLGYPLQEFMKQFARLAISTPT